MRKPGNQYWFPARRYGWGWGLPTAWQGWAVLAIYAACIGLLVWLAPPSTSALIFFALAALAALLLTLVCWFKGEPPHWRWGSK